MKKTVIRLSLTAVLALLAVMVPIFSDSTTASAAGDFIVTNGVLTGYNGQAADVVIPDGVTTVEKSAFNGKTGITSITVPASVTKISPNAFDTCTALAEFRTKGTGGSFSVRNGVLYSADGKTIVRVPINYSAARFVVPASVKTVGSYALYKCRNISCVTVDYGPTVISAHAVQNLPKLEVLTVSNTVTDIGSAGVSYNAALRYVNFRGRPAGVSSDAFTGCTSLASVTYRGSGNEWTSSGLSKAFSGSVKVFCDMNVLDYTLYEYYGTKTDVEIPDFVTAIDNYAFDSGSAKNVARVILPASVTDIDADAFTDCPTLQNIDVASGNRKYASKNGVLYSRDSSEIIRFPEGRADTGYTLPSSVRTVGDSAFYQCKKLKTVVIPDSVTAIKDYAFGSCTALTGTVLGKSVRTVGVRAFENCASLGRLTLPKSVTGVGSYAFSGAKIGAVDIKLLKPSGFGQKVFENAEITAVNYIGSADEWKNNGWEKAFSGAVRKATNYNAIKAAILRQPANQTVREGCSVTLSLEAEGSGLGYQWYFKKAGQTEWSVWSGHTRTSETVTPNETWDGIQLYCKLTDANGNSVNSSAAKITVLMKLAITKQPADQTVQEGGSVTLSVAARGNGLKYQWYYKKADQTKWTLWNGRTHASETVTPNDTWDGIRLYCKVTDQNGESLNSTAVKITVLMKLAITEQPVSQSVPEGGSVTLSVKAKGNGLKYQWYFKKAGQTEWSVWSGRTNASETVTPNDTWDGIQLRCKVTDQNGETVTSSAAKISLILKLAITKQPVDQTVQEGGSVTLSVAARGNGLKYQWYFKKAGQTEWTLWNGRTHATETAAANDTWDGIRFYCKVTDTNGGAMNSSAAKITVLMKLAITKQPADQTVQEGGSLTLSVGAKGNGLKYQWYFKKAGQTEWTLWNGRTHATETVTPNDTWDGIRFYCKVTDANGESLNSSEAKITVRVGLAITKQPADQTVAEGGSVTLSVTAKGSGLQYQWFFKKAGQSYWSIWNGRTHATETVATNATWNGIQFYCLITDSDGNAVQSDTATVTFR